MSRRPKARGQRKHGWLVGGTVVLVFALVAAGLGIADAGGVLAFFRDDSVRTTDSSPAAHAAPDGSSPSPARARSVAAREPAGPVLGSLGGPTGTGTEATSQATPTSAGLAKALRSALGSEALKPHVSIAVRDLVTGRLLYGKDAASGYIPASTTKILTGTAVLATLGPAHRFETKVVPGRRTGEIVLVGGGDPYFATAAARARFHDPAVPEAATVEELAERTAQALRARGTSRVTVRFDESLFQGKVSPTWEPEYVPSGVVSPISALWVDEGRLAWPAWRPRTDDPAMTAAKAFVQALEDAGIAVRGEPTRGKARAASDPIASVFSAPLSQIVEYTLLVSDNDAAEVLARHVAIAEGEPATFDGATRAIKRVLGRLGVTHLDQITLRDGSGLSRDDRISANVITQVLVTAARPEFPDLRPVITGLPVAGYSGSLKRRFQDSGAREAVGVARAKTGTLHAVSSLAGVVTTRGGSALAFAVMADRAYRADPEPAIDRVVASLAACGCRS